MVSADPNPAESVVSWVTPAWLADHLLEELLILDCQPSIHEYIGGHIPRAVYLNENVWRAHEGTCPGRWINREAATWVLRQIGVDARRPGRGLHRLGHADRLHLVHRRRARADHGRVLARPVRPRATSGSSTAGSTPGGRKGIP